MICMKVVSKCKDMFLSFSGRVNRKCFIRRVLFILFTMILSIVSALAIFFSSIHILEIKVLANKLDLYSRILDWIVYGLFKFNILEKLSFIIDQILDNEYIMEYLRYINFDYLENISLLILIILVMVSLLLVIYIIFSLISLLSLIVRRLNDAGLCRFFAPICFVPILPVPVIFILVLLITPTIEEKNILIAVKNKVQYKVKKLINSRKKYSET